MAECDSNQESRGPPTRILQCLPHTFNADWDGPIAEELRKCAADYMWHNW
jgi:hypothetical protein